jgi:CubicO group peptidase (beta-lactamase class C family)
MGALDMLSTWPVERVAAVVVDPGGVVAAGGPLEDVFAWASVTKLATALAIWVAVEEGSLGLDEPAGPPGSTVAHLLAHASGLPPQGREPLAAPGERRIYSNTGYEVLADRLTQATHISFGEYLTESVLGPLAMVRTRLAAGGSAASALHGTIGDLAALASEWLVPSLVDPSSVVRARTIAFPGLAGVLPGFGRLDPCDWGLGPEVKSAKFPHWTGHRNSPTTFGHFGISGSFLWVDPLARLACCVLTDTAFGAWAVRAWPVFSDAVLDEFAGPR